MKYKNIGELIKSNAGKFKDGAFLVFSEDNSNNTYKEFDEITNKVANYLNNKGIKKGDHIAVIMGNCPEVLHICYGCMKLGVVACVVNPDLNKEEIDYIINYSDAKLVFKEDDNKLEEFNSESDDQITEDINLNDVALMLFTSGTTGKPKGVIQTQGNILYDSEAIAERADLKEGWTLMCNMPLFHGGGQIFNVSAAVIAGVKIILNKKFSKSRFWKYLEKYEADYTMVVPTMLSMLMNPSEDISQYDLKNLKFTLCSAAPLQLELAKEFERTFNLPIVEAYGLSETTCQSTMNYGDKRRRLGSIGPALEVNEVAIVDDNDKQLPPGEQGEIVMKGPVVTPGYYKLPEKNKEAFKNGWFHTGDIGYVDNEGYFYITDRKKDIIIRGGENISPSEIDNILYKHSAVADAATIGVPDEIYGEEIKSCVVLKEESKATEKELIDFCKDHLANFKCPKSIEFVDLIPKGPSGKLLRKELRQKFA